LHSEILIQETKQTTTKRTEEEEKDSPVIELQNNSTQFSLDFYWVTITFFIVKSQSGQNLFAYMI
jgi:hypothetical protein